jgi:phosphocarrier protein
VSKGEMKETKVVVAWKEGLHARPCAKLARIAQKFGSTIQLECNGQVANARSFLSILLLCATMGSTLSVQVQGEDEEKAIRAVEQVFAGSE